jgi:hypothetical protein
MIILYCAYIYIYYMQRITTIVRIVLSVIATAAPISLFVTSPVIANHKHSLLTMKDKAASCYNKPAR